MPSHAPLVLLFDSPRTPSKGRTVGLRNKAAEMVQKKTIREV